MTELDIEQESPSYHDVYVTTKDIKRTSIFNLPFSIELTCTRVGGWRLWDGEAVLAGEYDKGLRVDVAGHVIVDSLPARLRDGDRDE